jgi:hypothetical protein
LNNDNTCEDRMKDEDKKEDEILTVYERKLTFKTQADRRRVL